VQARGIRGVVDDGEGRNNRAGLGLDLERVRAACAIASSAIVERAAGVVTRMRVLAARPVASSAIADRAAGVVTRIERDPTAAWYDDQPDAKCSHIAR
jgi:hypothetical protein